jgi:hypothetical protein
MALNADWDFEEAISKINETYPPYGRVGPQLRNRQIESWGQIVGRTRALISFDEAITRNGSMTAFGRKYQITADTLRKLRLFFEDLPDENLQKEKEIIERMRLVGHEDKFTDAKRELLLKEVGDKIEFIKDVSAMANNNEPSYIVIGLEDGNFEPVGRLSFHHKMNDINQILSGKIDPPVIVGYREFEIDGNEYGFVEIYGHNPPYIIARDMNHSQTDKKRTKISKGTIFVRHADRTEGISRAELEEMFKNRQ